MLYAPEHPLATYAPRVFEHRKVFYDAYGHGDHSCHVCGTSVAFEALHVDHLDYDKTNNELDNLAPACAGCNMRRTPKVGNKISKWKADLARSLRQSGKRMTDIAEECGISLSSTYTIMRGNHYSASLGEQ
jgi:5-methylcytosine-specific restriction endonuclease McrA